MDQAPDPQQPDPTEQLSRHAYYQLVHTLYGLLPPPLTDTPEALLARNQAASAKIAALAPVNADEADIAAHCVCARAQAEDAIRLTRQHAGDISLMMKLNAQYALMERTAISLRTHLLRLQTARHKREADSTAANADEWTRYIAARRMQQALEQGLGPAGAAAPVPAQPGAPPAAPEPVIPVPDTPPPVLAAVLSPAPAAQPTPSVRAAVPTPPARPSPASAPDAVPPRRHRGRAMAEADETPRDLAAEADYYAVVYPYRARPIRQYGGLPPDCSFGPPDDELVRAIVTGTSPTLRALDDPAAAA